MRAALTRHHPKQAAGVLQGIGPSTGPAAVIGVKMLIDRITALAKSKDSSDRAAFATLSERGITAQECKRLEALVEIAERGTSKLDPSPDAEARAAKAKVHQQALIDLRSWYEDWSEMARATIKRRERSRIDGLRRAANGRICVPGGFRRRHGAFRRAPEALRHALELAMRAPERHRPTNEGIGPSPRGMPIDFDRETGASEASGRVGSTST